MTRPFRAFDTFSLPFNADFPMGGTIRRVFEPLVYDVRTPQGIFRVWTPNGRRMVIYPGGGSRKYFHTISSCLGDSTNGRNDFRYMAQMVGPQTVHWAFIPVFEEAPNPVTNPEYTAFRMDLITNNKLDIVFYQQLQTRVKVIQQAVQAMMDLPTVRESAPRRFVNGAWNRVLKSLKQLRTLDKPFAIVQILGAVQRAIAEGEAFCNFSRVILLSIRRGDLDVKIEKANVQYIGAWGNMLDLSHIHALLDVGVPLYFIYKHNAKSFKDHGLSDVKEGWGFCTIPAALEHTVALSHPKHSEASKFWRSLQTDPNPVELKFSVSADWLHRVKERSASRSRELSNHPENRRAASEAYQITPASVANLPYEQKCKVNDRYAILHPIYDKEYSDEPWRPWGEHESCRGLYLEMSTEEFAELEVTDRHNIWYDRHNRNAFYIRYPLIHMANPQACHDDFGQPFPYCRVFLLERDGDGMMDAERPRWIYSKKTPPPGYRNIPLPPEARPIKYARDVARYYELFNITLPLEPEKFLLSSEGEAEGEQMTSLPPGQVPLPVRHPLYNQPERHSWQRTIAEQVLSYDPDVPVDRHKAPVLEGLHWQIMGHGHLVPDLPAEYYQPMTRTSKYQLNEDYDRRDLPLSPFIVSFEYVNKGTSIADWIMLLAAIARTSDQELTDLVLSVKGISQPRTSFLCKCVSYDAADLIRMALHGQSLDGRSIFVSFVQARYLDTNWVTLTRQMAENAPFCEISAPAAYQISLLPGAKDHRSPAGSRGQKRSADESRLSVPLTEQEERRSRDPRLNKPTSQTSSAASDSRAVRPRIDAAGTFVRQTPPSVSEYDAGSSSATTHLAQSQKDILGQARNKAFHLEGELNKKRQAVIKDSLNPTNAEQAKYYEDYLGILGRWSKLMAYMRRQEIFLEHTQMETLGLGQLYESFEDLATCLDAIVHTAQATQKYRELTTGYVLKMENLTINVQWAEKFDHPTF